ncbi:MarR family winged helix-turn-helix transcriptional regulator [Actinomadura hibisca]|uniref:MarR family winged helix-turn-helix transcriptional regulator n=1 Tax=Actinomadura hibisca TaxID=68565 RepID=UPI000833B70D|nr:MarR family winged helix-turn-helix transcriptional regulator [Actinomadura hibisca]
MTDASQPIGYWSGEAHRRTITFIRAQIVELGLTQPQYWILRNLSRQDLSPDGQGRTVDELVEAMSDYLLPEDDVQLESHDLLARGLLRLDGDDRLWITEAGEAARTRVKRHAPAIRDRIHAGISDEEYTAALAVLQKMIANTTPA